MKDKESLLPKDWFNKGDIDLRRVELLLDHDDTSDAAFHLQQAIEKYLKGYLISNGWKLIRIHDLEDLLDYAVDYDKDFEDFRALCQVVTEYYIEERYPFLQSSVLTEEEVRQSLDKAIALINKIKTEYK